MSTRSNDRYIGYIFLASIFWGTSFPSVAFGLRYASPEQLMLLRFLIALLVAVIFYSDSLLKVLTSRSLMLVGFINGFAYLLQFIGQQWVPAGQSSVLINSFVITTPFFAYFIIGESLTTRKILAALIGLVGVVFITNNSAGSAGITPTEHLIGVVIVFSSGTAWGLYATLSKKVQTDKGDSTVNSSSLEEKNTHHDVFIATLIYTSVVAIIGVLISGKPINPMFKIEPLFTGAYLAIFCTVIPFSLYLRSLDHVNVGLSVIILLLEVIVSFLISTTYLRESVGISQVIGTLFIITGIVLAITGNNAHNG